MKTKTKDILMICKGWYNRDKYESPLEALKAYQSVRCAISLEYLSLKKILDYSLLPTAKQFFDLNDWVWIFTDGILKDIEYGYMFKNLPEFNFEYFCNKFIVELSNLTIKDDNGNWIIDLSDYSDEPII